MKSEGSCRLVSLCTALLGILAAACSEPGQSPFEPQFSSSTPTPVECPTAVTQSVSGLIGPLGGVLSVGGSSVTIPLGAVLLPKTFTLTIPSSQYMEIEVTAADVEHYVFQKPVTMTIDYSRCTRNDIEHAPLTIWYWDGSTLIDDMGGTDDKVARTVTFGTPHLSGYVIAD